MVPLFIATQRFDPSDAEKWQSYILWAKIPALTELVSLDSILCPTILSDIEPEDWNHIVNESFRTDYFYDLDYLVSRAAAFARRNVLGVYRNPDSHIQTPPAPDGFTFLGYDLVEDTTGVSALTNCGGFPESFSNDELNTYGLIPKFERAVEVKIKLAAFNPEEPHAHCEMYAIWRLTEQH